MNINLNNVTPDDMMAEKPIDMITGSAEILAMNPDTRPVGPPVLVPFDAESYPGVYVVWYPVCDGDGDGQWVSVDADGQIQRIDYLPSAYEVGLEAGTLP